MVTALCSYGTPVGRPSPYSLDLRYRMLPLMTRLEVRWLTDTFQQAQPFKGQTALATYQGGLSHLVLPGSVLPFQASFRALVTVSLCWLLPRIAQAGRLRPIFSILEINVVGFTPKSSAAPLTPLIFQPVFCRTTKRFSRSRRCISGSVRYSDWAFSAFCGAKGIGSSDEPVTGRSNSSVPDRAKITARSMTFRSSRMLPGQS